MRKKILYIWDADYPWDVRVEKTCNALKERELEVHLVCRNLKQKKREERYNGVYLHRLPFLKNIRLNYLVSFPIFCSPLWLWQIFKVVKERRIDLIIVRDLPLCLSAILIGKLTKIPIIFDMAEHYPAMLKDIWKYSKFRVLNLFLRNPLLAAIVEKISLKFADHILVVCKESKKRIFRCYEHKISIIHNTPLVSSLRTDANIKNTSWSIPTSRFVAIYTGGLEDARGLDEILQCVPRIVEKIPTFLLLIVGRGVAEKKLISIIENNKNTDWVKFMGWIPNDEIPNLIKKCHIGLIPHYSTEHTNTTLPNKLFDYMAQGKPVLARALLPIQRILTDERCGLIFNNSEEFVKNFLTLYTNEKLRVQLGLNGMKAIKEKYNWEEDSNELVNVIKNLIGNEREKQ